MSSEHIDVIATTVSGSIEDWKKVERIVPLFQERGLSDVELHVVKGHLEARRKACEVIRGGGRIPISAGGSGTFKSVLEGCIDSGIPLSEIRLGFLRKGSADLIGKVLGMPDDVVAAAEVFAAALAQDCTVPCDVLSAESIDGDLPKQHFVGYGGAELFGRIPYFTENRMMKWYKGVLGQIFGDLGPFTTGMTLALIERLVRGVIQGRRPWKIRIDGEELAVEEPGAGRYQALIIVNGYLGPELAFSRDPLGSGRFHLHTLEDRGSRQLLAQAQAARSGRILEDPDRWGLRSYPIDELLELEMIPPASFPANIDGSTLRCDRGLRIRRCDRVRLIAGTSDETRSD